MKSFREEKPTTCCTYILSIDSKVTSKAIYSPAVHSLLRDEKPKISSKLSALSVKGARVLGHPEANGTISAPKETAHEAMIYTEADSSIAETSEGLSKENEMLMKSDKGWMTSKDFRQEFDTDLFGSVEGRSKEQKSLSDETQEEGGDSDGEEATPRRSQLASPSDDGYIRKIELLGESERRLVFDSMEVKEKLVDPIKVEKLEASVEFDQANISEVKNASDDADFGVLRSSAIAEASLDSASTARKVLPEGPQSTSMLRLNEASKKNKSREKETANVESIACSSEEKTQVHDSDRSTPLDENIKRTTSSFKSCGTASMSTRQGSDVGNLMTKLGSSFQGQSKADSSERIWTSMVRDDETTEAVPFNRQNQELNTSSLGSFASISTLKSLVSGLFNSVGLGRQPTFPSRTSEDQNSAGIIKRQTNLMSRQFSTSNAVPSENYDDDERALDSVEEVSATDGGKEMCEGASADTNEMMEEPADRPGKCQSILKYQVPQEKVKELKNSNGNCFILIIKRLFLLQSAFLSIIFDIFSSILGTLKR